MGFMDQFAKMAGSMFGGDQQQAADAASDHVANADPNETADHLQQSVPNMDQSSLMSLGQQLLHHFTQSDSFAGNGEDAAQAAGTDAQAVRDGDPSAISRMVDYAKANPQVLQGAASAFMQRNPGALMSMAPGFLQSFMGGRSGGASAPQQNDSDDRY